MLRRKLGIVKTRYSKSLAEYEKYAFVAVGNIYGVELLQDNAQECRDRLLGIVASEYPKVAKKSANPRFLPVIEFVLNRNILCGDALSLKAADNEPSSFRSGRSSRETRSSGETFGLIKCWKATRTKARPCPLGAQAGPRQPNGNSTRKPSRTYPCQSRNIF